MTFISPTVDPATRTLRIKAEIDNDEGHLRPGLFARVSLGVAPRSGVVMVPEEALIQRSEGALLFKIDRGEPREARHGHDGCARRRASSRCAATWRRENASCGAVTAGSSTARMVAVRDADPRAVAAQKGEEAEGAEL